MNNDSMSGNTTLFQVNGPPRFAPAGQAGRWRLPRCRRFCKLKFPGVRGAERAEGAEGMNATESNAMKHAQLLFFLGVLMVSATAALAKPAYVASTVNLRAAPGTTSEIVAKIPGGSLIDAKDCSEGWCAVTWQEKSGFAIQTAYWGWRRRWW